MKSKFRMYDKVKDVVTNYNGTVTAIFLKGTIFSYLISTGVDEKQAFLNTEFEESRLELTEHKNTKIGFNLETN